MKVITKSGFPRPKFIISVFSERVNCEKKLRPLNTSQGSCQSLS